MPQWVDDFRDVVKEASGSRKKAAGRRSRQCEDVETATVLGAALVEALARLVRSHLRCQAKEVAEGRELAMEDIDVVKVGRCKRLDLYGRGGKLARLQAALSMPQALAVICAKALGPAVLLPRWLLSDQPLLWLTTSSPSLPGQMLIELVLLYFNPLIEAASLVRPVDSIPHRQQGTCLFEPAGRLHLWVLGSWHIAAANWDRLSNLDCTGLICPCLPLAVCPPAGVTDAARLLPKLCRADGGAPAVPGHRLPSSCTPVSSYLGWQRVCVYQCAACCERALNYASLLAWQRNCASPRAWHWIGS